MNFSRYFLLVSAAILVVSVQKTDAGVYEIIKDAASAVGESIKGGYQTLKEAIQDIKSPSSQRARETNNLIKQDSKESIKAGYSVDAVRFLRQGYTNCSNIVSKSKKTVLDGLSNAERLILEQPEEAVKVADQAIEVAKKLIFLAGIQVYQSLGLAKAVSNDGAKEGLLDAYKTIAKGGIGTLDSLAFANTLIDTGANNGGKAALQSVKAARECVSTGYEGLFRQIEKSYKKAMKALKDAQDKPIYPTIQNSGAEDVNKDADAVDAAKSINEAADNAIKVGANANKVNKVRTVLLNSLGELARVSAELRKEAETNQKLSEIQPQGSQVAVSESPKRADQIITITVGNTYLIFVEAAFDSGNPWNSDIGNAIGLMEQGKAEITLGRATAGKIEELGNDYEDSDAPKIGVQAAIDSARYGKIALFQRFVQAAQVVFDVLTKRPIAA